MTTPGTAQPRTVTSEVTVGIDPQTAFNVFTEEINLWWVRGPINFYDGTRAIGMRCEPGVGGRLLELYNEDGSDALETGRIITWQPGELLAWNSSLDDVTVEVRFQPVAAGTRVTVAATVPAGGADRGGSAWVRVVPAWLGTWCERRETAPREPAEMARLALALYYLKPLAAARWLVNAFGFAPTLELADEDLSGDDHRWIELRTANCSLILFPLDEEPAEGAPVTHVPWVFVDDLDGHFDRGRAEGAAILSDIHQHGYRSYQAADLEGYRWTFVQARPSM